jgi:hypothetical protein
VGINSTDERRNDKAEIKSLRGAAGHTLRDEISNGTIRHELQMFNIVQKIADLKNKCNERLTRMKPRREARKAGTYPY